MAANSHHPQVWSTSTPKPSTPPSAPDCQKPTNPHDYYLQLKGRGYYKNACPGTPNKPCGQPKSVQARLCIKCSGFSPQPSLCECGERKHRLATKCHACSNPHHATDPNSYCPNGGLGGAECEARYPHRHCVCGEPIESERTLCDACKQDAARIANKRLTRVA